MSGLTTTGGLAAPASSLSAKALPPAHALPSAGWFHVADDSSHADFSGNAQTLVFP